MWLDNLVPDGELASQQQKLQFTAEPPEPGFWDGSGSAIGPNLERGFLEAGASIESGFSSMWQGALDGLAGALLPEPKHYGRPDVTSAERSQQRTLGEGTAAAVKELRPDPRTTGTGGQLLGEAAAILPRTVVGTFFAGPLGGATMAGAPAGYSSKQVAMSEGIDESTATLQGVIEGTTVGVGALLPAAKFVKPVTGDLAIAVGANVGLGVASRGLTGELLEGAGYTEQAAQYRALDGTGMAIDAVLGAAFFGIGRGMARRPAPQHVDAALVENNALHAELDTAPGIPVDPQAANTHLQALDIATEQLARGERVLLPDDMPEAAFLRAIDEDPVSTPGRTEIESQALEVELPAIRAELEQQAARALPNVRDLRTEAATLQRTLDGLDSTFRERAKAFQGEGVSRKQAESQARQVIQQERGDIKQRLEQISEQIEANRQAEAARGELASIGRGDLPPRVQERIRARADQLEQGFQRKPLANQIAQGNRRFSIRQLASKELNRLINEAELAAPRLEPTEVKPSAVPAARGAQQTSPEGAIEKMTTDGGATYPSSSLEAGAPRQPHAAADFPTVARDQDASIRPGAADAADPEVRLAQSVLDEVGDIQVPTGAIDADGNPVTVSARELLAEADADIQRAQLEGRGIEAAAGCALQRGD